MLFRVDITHILHFTADPNWNHWQECQDCFAQFLFLPELADSTPGSPGFCYHETEDVRICSASPVVTLNLHISLPLPGHCFHIHLHLQTIYYCTHQLLILWQLIVYLHCSFLPSPQLLITHYCTGSENWDQNQALLAAGLVQHCHFIKNRLSRIDESLLATYHILALLLFLPSPQLLIGQFYKLLH